MFSRLSVKLVTFLHLKTKSHRSYVLTLFTKFQCGSCNATYYGKTKHHFKARIYQHLGISVLTGKVVKGDDDYVIKEHFLFCDHTPDFVDISILATNKVTLRESLPINRDHPSLNKNKHSLPLQLCDS